MATSPPPYGNVLGAAATGASQLVDFVTPIFSATLHVVIGDG
jgi:hypothetical protein